MSKKSNEIEVLAPVRPVPNVRAELEAFIKQQMVEIMGADETGIFEPWFQRKAIAREIRRLQTVPQQRKWHDYFREWGCLVCDKKDGRYLAEGMCATCYSRIKLRLQTILRFTKRERPDSPSFAPDRLTELASGAVQRRLEAPKETRDYITKAERRAIRGPHRHSDAFLVQRLKARERRASREEIWRQARNLHVEQDLTYREITQRLDPEGFARDPKVATRRMQDGAHRVQLVRDLTDLARKALKCPPRPLPPEKRKSVKSIACEAQRSAQKALPERTSPKHTGRSR